LAYATYELHARQQTSLTPRLQQSVKLLQMSTLEFSREIQQALAENPFLEDKDEFEPEEDGMAPPDGMAYALQAPPSAASVREEQAPAASPEPRNAHDEPLASGEYSGDYPASHNNEPRDTDVGLWARSTVDMRERLRGSLSGYRLGERDRALAEYIIDALDDDGYLRLPLEDLANRAEFNPPVDDAEWDIALKLVQHLDIPGLAARNLSECLCLQLAALPASTPARDLALRICRQALEQLARKDYNGLRRELECEEAELRQACELVRRLDPRPGSRFLPADPSCYVTPDVAVRKEGKVWKVVLNRANVPRARLHRTYADLFRKTRYDDRSPMAQALQEARWLLRNVEQRFATIERVAQAIVARQQAFFEYGEIALRPLMLREVAEELGIHESTVSRATTNKYMATPRGVYEFKHFFSRELVTRTGGTCSAAAVRALIQEMIDAENPADPLSDVALAERLAREGVMVARRTVSKYRAQIKYPPAELRREA